MALFKKKKKKEEKTEISETPELSEEEGISETLVDEGEMQNILGDVLKGSGIDDISEKIDSLVRRIDEFQSKMERHESMISSLQNEISEMRKVNEEMQDNIKRLLDIYEVVSQKINPFIDMGEKAESPITGDTVIPVKKVPEAEIPSEIEEFPSKFQGMEEIEERRKESGTPILRHIKKDYYTIVLLMRWIEFLFERVKRDKITLLLDYYVDIGWIGREVKSEIMAYARGEVQDVTKYFPEEELEAEVETPEGTIKAPSPRVYKKVEDWRLSAEDHLKSLLFIMKIAGIEVNKDKLNSLEQEIEKFKRSLWEFHRV